MSVLNCKRRATAPTPVSGVATWRTWRWHTWHVSGDKRGDQVPLLIVPSDHYDHHHCCTWHGTVHSTLHRVLPPPGLPIHKPPVLAAKFLISEGKYFLWKRLDIREGSRQIYFGCWCWWMLLCCQKLFYVFPTSVKAGILEKCKHVSTSLME